MRILIAHSSYRILGGEDRYVDQQTALLARRHEIEVVRPPNSELSAGIGTAFRMTYSRRQLAALIRTIQNFRPDLIHVHNPYPSLGPAAHLAAKRTGVPLVMTVHNHRLRCPNGYMFTEGRPCTRCEAGNYSHAVLNHCFPSKKQSLAYATALWTHRFLLHLESTVSIFIAPSIYLAERLRDWGIDEERVAMVPNFVDPPPKIDPHSIDGYGMYAGRMSPEKGLRVLLEALGEAGDPPFLFVGDGPQLPELRALASRLGLSNSRFCGLVTAHEVRKLMEKAQFIALPSTSDEGCPLSALEAMAAGRALLVSNRGGLPELVDHDPVLICRAGVTYDWAAGIRKLMSAPTLCEEIGRRMLANYRQKYTAEVHLELLERAYARATTSTMAAGS